MTAASSDLGDPVSPTEEDARLARESSARLAGFLTAWSGTRVRCRVEAEDRAEESVVMPAAAIKLLQRILTEMAEGNALRLIPVHAKLTTQQAADLLKVSRPFLVERLEKGDMPFHLVGNHRRILLTDVMQYKECNSLKRLEVLERPSALDQELGNK